MKFLLKILEKVKQLREWWAVKKAAIKRKSDVEKDIKKRIAQKKKQKKQYRIKPYIEKAGLDVNVQKLTKFLFNLCVGLNFFFSIYLIYYFSSSYGYSVYYVLFIMVLLWTLVFLLLLFVTWLFFHLVLDLRIFQRKILIEQVLPDFLQLASANIRAGMPIDRALWLAVRPRFGVLSKEIEIVAKQTMSGEDLEKALASFADKYDSLVLKRSINLLIEGIRAGGEIGDLLNKVSINIKESQLLRKEMAADVTSYAIFITFASIVAAPFLFGLSYQLLGNITEVMGSLDTSQSSNTMGFSIGGAVSLTPDDFKIFAYVVLSITSFFSASIVAIIKKGEVKAGLKMIPIFILTSVTVFAIASFLMAKLFGDLF